MRHTVWPYTPQKHFPGALCKRVPRIPSEPAKLASEPGRTRPGPHRPGPRRTVPSGRRPKVHGATTCMGGSHTRLVYSRHLVRNVFLFPIFPPRGECKSYSPTKLRSPKNAFRAFFECLKFNHGLYVYLYVPTSPPSEPPLFTTF